MKKAIFLAFTVLQLLSSFCSCFDQEAFLEKQRKLAEQAENDNMNNDPEPYAEYDYIYEEVEEVPVPIVNNAETISEVTNTGENIIPVDLLQDISDIEEEDEYADGETKTDAKDEPKNKTQSLIPSPSGNYKIIMIEKLISRGFGFRPCQQHGYVVTDQGGVYDSEEYALQNPDAGIIFGPDCESYYCGSCKAVIHEYGKSYSHHFQSIDIHNFIRYVTYDLVLFLGTRISNVIKNREVLDYRKLAITMCESKEIALKYTQVTVDICSVLFNVSIFFCILRIH